MKKLGVAIQGAGWVSTEHIRAFLNNPHCEIRAINTSSYSRFEAKRSEFDLSPELWMNDYDALLKRDDVDIVSICTINHRHAQEAISAAQAGKHVLIEKPIAITLDELYALRDTIEEAGVKSLAGFVLRWNPLIQTIKELIKSGDLGEIFYIATDYWHEVSGGWKVKRNLAGNSLLMGCCHAIDALRWLTEGDEVVEVSAYACPARRRRDFEFEPTYSIIMKLASGAVGKAGTSLECNMPYVFNVEILGTKGSIRNDKLFCDRFVGLTDFMKIPTILPDSGDVAHHPFHGEIDHFVDCILNDYESHLCVSDSVKTHEICFAAELSAREGRPVKLPLRE